MTQYKKNILLVLLFLKQSLIIQGNDLLNQIKQVALNTSGQQTQTLFNIQTIDEYAMSKSNIIQKNTQPCRYIIDARGDGNCGYRAFIGSIFLNKAQFKNQQLIPHIQKLLDEKYVQLFIKYDQQFTSNKNAAAIEIQKYLKEQLNILNNFESIEEVYTQLNKEYAFNYYMIMFLRYLIVQYINTLNISRINTMIHQRSDKISNKDNNIFNSATEEECLLAFAAIDDNITLDAYKQKILTWKDELTLDQTKLLSTATNITIYTISESNPYQPLAITKNDQEYGVATILYVEGHYKMFIPKFIEGLANFFEPDPAQLQFEAFKSLIDKSISFSQQLYSNIKMKSYIFYLIQFFSQIAKPID